MYTCLLADAKSKMTTNLSNAFNDRAQRSNDQVYSPDKGDKADKLQKTTETDNRQNDYGLSSLFIGRGAIWEH